MKESVMMERDSKGRFVKKNNTPANNRHSIRDSKGRFVSAKEVKPDINEQASLCSVAYYWFNVFTSCLNTVLYKMTDEQKEAIATGCDYIKTAFDDFVCHCNDNKPARDSKGRFVKKGDKCLKKK